MRRKRRNRGFGLMEVLIASTIIILVIGAITALGSASVRSSATSADKTAAYYLAQEGIEAVRSIRDTAWVDGYPTTNWDFGWYDSDTANPPSNGINNTDQCPRDEDCPVNGVGDGCGNARVGYGLKQVAGKWQLTTTDLDTQKKDFTAQGGNTFYRNILITNVSWFEPPVISIPMNTFPDDQNAIIRKVDVEVKWLSDQGICQKINMSTYLTDWKMVE